MACDTPTSRDPGGVQSLAALVADRIDGPSSKEPQCLAVMYHYVRDDEPLPRVSTPGNLGTIHGLSSAEFTAQLDFLCRAMEPISWPALYAGLCGTRPLPHRCFLLTFDDGPDPRSTPAILDRWLGKESLSLWPVLSRPEF